MDVKIKILNVLCYQDKETKEDKTRIGYIMGDEKSKQSSDKFKGYNELSSFYNGKDVFNKLPIDIFDKVVIAVIESQTSPINPLKEYKYISKLKFDNNVINLL